MEGALMNWRIKPRWIVWVIAPAIINLIFWKFLVLPKENSQHSLEKTMELVEKAPRYSSLLSESKQVLDDWNERGFLSADISRMERDVQKLANTSGVAILSRSSTNG